MSNKKILSVFVLAACLSACGQSESSKKLDAVFKTAAEKLVADRRNLEGKWELVDPARSGTGLFSVFGSNGRFLLLVDNKFEGRWEINLDSLALKLTLDGAPGEIIGPTDWGWRLSGTDKLTLVSPRGDQHSFRRASP